MGSKNRHAKELLPIITKNYDPENPNQWYIEPFCGGCNMIDKVAGERRWANDLHEYLIAMFKALQEGWVPPDLITEDDYRLIKDYKNEFDSHLVGYVGFLFSFGSKWFGGYARNEAGTKGSMDNMKKQSQLAKNGVLKQLPLIQSVTFTNLSYVDLEIKNQSIIYCDPPYASTTGYKDSFQHDIFWEWAEIMVEFGHEVFVSEYTAPSNWQCVWKKETTANLFANNENDKVRIEKLFKLH